MVRYINEKWTHLGASGNFWGDSPYPTLASDWSQPSHSFAVKLTNTITSKAVNEFQFSIAGNDIIITTSPETQALQDEIASKFRRFSRMADGTLAARRRRCSGARAVTRTSGTRRRGTIAKTSTSGKTTSPSSKGSHDLEFGGLFSHNFKDEPGSGAGGGNQQLTIQGCGEQTVTALPTCC